MTDGLVCLEGLPRAVGREFGRVNGADIAREMGEFYRTLEEVEKIRTADLLKAGKHFRALVRKYAPHWIAEAEALAEEAGVDAELYMTYQGAKYRGTNRPECFSYFSAPSCNAAKVTLLHKNRDNVARPQCAYVKGIRLPRRRLYRFMTNADTPDMGLMMALNEKGLAIVADQGHPDPHPRQLGMMNSDVMRIIVEQAADVKEAMEILREIHADRAYAGGKISTYWMLADRCGAGLRVYHFHEEIVTKEPERGMLVMRDEDARGELVKKTLAGRRGRVSSGLMNWLSRQQPVLATSNVSAYTAVIPPRQTELFAYAWFAVNSAGKVLYVPLYMGVKATPRPLLDGTIFRLSNRHPYGANLFAGCKEQGVDLEAFEQEMEEDRANMEAVARQALRQRGGDAARQVLTDGCLRFARQAERILRLLGRT